VRSEQVIDDRPIFIGAFELERDIEPVSVREQAERLCSRPRRWRPWFENDGLTLDLRMGDQVGSLDRADDLVVFVAYDFPDDQIEHVLGIARFFPDDTIFVVRVGIDGILGRGIGLVESQSEGRGQKRSLRTNVSGCLFFCPIWNSAL